jgi:hypothetical protein
MGCGADAGLADGRDDAGADIGTGEEGTGGAGVGAAGTRGGAGDGTPPAARTSRQVSGT